MTKRLIFLVVAVCGIAWPAMGADIRQIDCPMSALSAAERTLVGQEAMALAETDDGVQALLRRVDQCRDRYGWTPVERRSAFLFAIGSIAEAGMRQSLAGRGIDFDALQAMVVADAVFVDSIYAEPPAEDPVRPFMDRHTAELVRIMGPTLAETDNARRTGLYIAFVAAREAGRRHFASR